ncbi:hypothetical protein IE53DRAFT_387459, partial [Violaceomyces palustris]
MPAPTFELFSLHGGCKRDRLGGSSVAMLFGKSVDLVFSPSSKKRGKKTDPETTFMHAHVSCFLELLALPSSPPRSDTGQSSFVTAAGLIPSNFITHSSQEQEGERKKGGGKREVGDANTPARVQEVLYRGKGGFITFAWETSSRESDPTLPLSLPPSLLPCFLPATPVQDTQTHTLS